MKNLPPLHTLIHARRDAIVERFVSELRKREAQTRELPSSLLINSLPRFLDELAESLQRGSTSDGTEAAARVHGEQRWEHRFDLDAMVREYGVLRYCVLQEMELLGLTLSIREFGVLADCLNAGIADAVTEYTRLQIEALNTERRRADLESGKSSSMLMQAPAPICILRGRELVFELANPLYCALLGRDDLLGKPLVEAVPELRGQPFHQQLESVMTSGEIMVAGEVPVKIVRWTGEAAERHYNFFYQPMRDVGGALQGVMVMALDVSEQIAARKSAERLARELQQNVAQRMRAERALRLNEERFRRALRGSPVVVSNQDRDLRYTWIHNALGRSEQEILGKTDAELLEGADDARAIEWIKREVLRTGTGQRREVATRAGERTTYFDLTVEPLLDDSGDAIGITCTATDITERKAIEQALRASEARFRTVHEASPDGLMILRSVRDEVGAIADFEWVYANPATEPILGGRGQGLEGKRLLVEMPGSVIAGAFETYSRVVETGQPSRTEVSCGFRGAPRGFRSLAVALGDGVAVSFHDITEQQRAEADRATVLEQEQKARQYAEQLNRLKDEFLATVSHELRTPLQSILGWARMLRSEEVDAEALEKGLGAVERNAMAQLQLVEDVLDASAIFAGKLRLRAERVDVRKVLDGALDQVRFAAQAKDVELATDVAENVGSLHGDAARLQQVVWNLLANAVKFTSHGGHVRLSALREGDHLEVRVDDDGEGILRSFVPFLFERFRQADGGMSRVHGGLGLGLAIVRHVVEAHGGTVRAESEGEGRGARFAIRIPLGATAAATPPSVAPASRATDRPQTAAVLEGLRLLVVEDETDTRELLIIIFSRAGAIVQGAASAPAALDALRSGRFDALVSDVGLPGEDGYALIQRLRALGDACPSSDVPALALTAYARAEDRRQALASGFQMHLAKPIEPSNLVNAVAHLVGRGGVRGASS